MQKQPTNLLNLQNLMKRDPVSYIEEFQQQWQLYLHQHNLVALAPADTHNNKPLLESFTALLSFLSHVAPCFPHITQPLLPTHLLALLSPPLVQSLPSTLRYHCAGCLILLQNRGMVSRFSVLPVLFSLMGVPDKRLRTLCTSHIIADIKRVNKHKHDVKLNSALQNFMYSMLKQSTGTAAQSNTGDAAAGGSATGRASSGASTDATTAKKALDVMVDLYRRRVWTDEKTVNVVVSACFHPNVRVMATALRFFLGISFYDEEEEEEEEQAIKKQTTRKQIVAKADHLKGIVKKRKKRQREITRANRRIKRLESKDTIHGDLPPLQLVHDPQSFAERLFSRLRSSSYSFVVRLLLMNVISRLIGEHRLILLNFYSFLQKYMQPHQRHVTVILTYLAQATHSLVPPDTLRPLLLHLTTQFVSDRSSAEVMAVGLNTIRELCSRQPLVMTRSLLADLVKYRRHKVKGVMMAARALLAVYREKMPALLARRERGKGVSDEERKRKEEGEVHDELFGQLEYSVDVAGAELLRQRETEEKEDAEGDDEWAMDDEGDAGEDEDEDDEEGEEGQEQRMASNKEVDEFLKELDGDEEEADGEEEEEEGEEAAQKADDEEAELERELDMEIADDDGEEKGAEEEEDGEDGEEDGSAEEEGEEEEADAEAGQEGEDGEEEDEAEEDEDAGDEQASDVKQSDASTKPSAKRQRVSFSSRVSISAPPATSTAADAATAPSAPALPYAATKIFTPKDFALLRQLQQQQKTSASPAANKKRSRPSAVVDDDSSEPSAVVAVDDLKGYQAKRRKSKEERLDSVRDGREGMKGGAISKTKGGGSTNAEKLKSKPFMLVKYSGEVRGKQRQAFNTVQKNQQTHIKNLKRQGKKAKRKMKDKRGY